MDAAVQHLRAASAAVPDDLLAHTSPVGWEHIAFSGDFLWDRAAASAGRKAPNLPPDRRAPSAFADCSPLPLFSLPSTLCPPPRPAPPPLPTPAPPLRRPCLPLPPPSPPPPPPPPP